MATSTETTLVSLFHTRERAMQAANDLQSAGIPAQAIQTISGTSSQGSAPEQALASLQSLQLPGNDLQVLADGLKSGGTVVIVRAEHTLADKAETVFERYDAELVDERGIKSRPDAGAAVTGDAVIPVVEEQVTLREEHATFERHAVNRPISEAELDALKDQSIEVREMAEEAVVGKTARVVEEVQIGKESTERTERITDSVRKTQVDVDQLPASDSKTIQRKV
jgi:hypothetical protein